MKIAIWVSEVADVDQRDRSELCDRLIEQFNLPSTATYRDACRRVGEVLSDHLEAAVELRFVQMRSTGLSGATALQHDGTYVVYCVKSRSWYHRLGILLHEFAHLVLGHQPVTLRSGEGLRSFMPHMPGKMARIIAGRTNHTEDEEREAEEFADTLLERLTAGRQAPDGISSTELAPHVMRVAEEFGVSPQEPKRS